MVPTTVLVLIKVLAVDEVTWLELKDVLGGSQVIRIDVSDFEVTSELVCSRFCVVVVVVSLELELVVGFSVDVEDEQPPKKRQSSV